MPDGSTDRVEVPVAAGGRVDTPCLAALEEALAQSEASAAAAIVRRCARAAIPDGALEQVLVAAERAISAPLRAAGTGATARNLEAIRAAVAVLERSVPAPAPAAAEQADQEAVGTSAGAAAPVVVLAGMPGDPQAGGNALWRWLLARQGYEVGDLGVKAPAAVVGRLAAAAPKAVACYVAGPRARREVQTLVGLLRHRELQVPVLIGGPGVDAAFAQWVALPEGGEPYWGGVYFCEDGAELLAVLQQIVLFTPAPSAHSHTHETHAPTPDEETCASCGGCPLVGACDGAVEGAG